MCPGRSYRPPRTPPPQRKSLKCAGCGICTTRQWGPHFRPGLWGCKEADGTAWGPHGRWTSRICTRCPPSCCRWSPPTWTCRSPSHLGWSRRSWHTSGLRWKCRSRAGKWKRRGRRPWRGLPLWTGATACSPPLLYTSWGACRHESPVMPSDKMPSSSPETLERWTQTDLDQMKHNEKEWQRENRLLYMVH